jgi:DNA invertase Pin-like site-specific DNA recombinase
MNPTPGVTHMRKAAVYLYANAPDQTAGNHEHELIEIARRMGCEIVKIYRDEEGGGTTGQKRPKLEKLCLDAYNRKFDMIMVWSVERLGRSLHDLVGFLSEIRARKVDLYLHKQGIDTTTLAGKAIFEMTDVFAEFERAVIRERLRKVRAKAKRDGKQLGRRRIDPAIKNAIRDALQKGDAGILRIAKRFGVGTGTVQRIKAEMTSEGAASALD